MTTSTRPLLSSGAARTVAYDWHGGQTSALYSFASVGDEIPTRILERAITEVSHDRATLPGHAAHSEHRRLGLLLAYLEHTLTERDTDGEDDD